MPRRPGVRRVSAKEFARAIRSEPREVVPEVVNLVRRKITLDIFSGVVKRSPVDEGYFRGSHNVSVRQKDYRKPKSPIPKGKREVARGLLGLNDLDLKSVIYITSNLPYSETIELGLYPNPPASGDDKTVGGFSRQAPRGVYRVTIASVIAKLKAHGPRTR
jgi:hypothetical protein